MKLHRNLLRVAVTVGLIFAFKPLISYGIDTTQCTVYNTSDSLNDDGIYPLNSLRRLIGNFNNTSWRFCTDKIDFNPKNQNGSEIPDEQAVTIKLTQPLLIDNPNDVNGLLLDGSTHSGKIIIDTTEVINPETQQQDDKCAIQITANTKKIKMQGITILTKQPNDVAHLGMGSNPNGNTGTATFSLSSEEAAVICDHDVIRNNADNDPSNDDDNDFVGVTFQRPEGMAVCGNSQKEGTEECDDGANNGADQVCTSECKKNLDMDGDGIPDSVDNCTPERVRNHTRPVIMKALNSDCLQGGVSLGFAVKSNCKSIIDAHLPHHSGMIFLSNPEDYKNPDQNNCDHDDLGDQCDNDWDNDGISDDRDNCSPVHPTDPNACDPAALMMSANADQKNLDGDAKGDLCDDDIDNDGIPNADDQCPSTLNLNQIDEDHDGCDDPVQNLDSDGDGVPDSADNCPIPNAGPLQLDTDGDGQGDLCDLDDDNDGMTDADELAGCQTPMPLNPLNKDSDGDGFEDGDSLNEKCPCDPNPACGNPPPLEDTDGDGVPNASDNCPNTPNADQANICAPDDPNADTDGDGVVNGTDNCPAVRNADQANRDGDNEGDACDANPDVNDNPPPANQSACSLSAISNSGSIAGSFFWGVALLMLVGFRKAKKG